MCKSVDMNVTLCAYNKSTIKQLGSCCYDVHFNCATEQCRFCIVEDSFKAFLGLTDHLHLGLRTIHDSVLNYTGSVGEIDTVHLNQRPATKVQSYLETISLITQI